ncbi:MAG: hypothetical protein II004_02285 [Erysipelotrichaceae bacterium]|nr:hypothetical protein [Erysipelotrichaceae bacterium]
MRFFDLKTKALKRILQKITLVVSVFLVFITSYLLVLPAISLNEETADEDPAIVTETAYDASDETGDHQDPDGYIEEQNVDTAAEHILTFFDDTTSVIVSVEAPENAFPEGTRMIVTPVEAEEIMDTVSSMVNRVDSVVAVDITFYDADGREVEPLVPISVSMSSKEIVQNNDPLLLHIDDEGNTAIIEDTEISDDTLVFVSDAFSTYVLVTTIEDVTLASDGKNYKITVTYNEDANIPEDAELSVEEILESDDSSEYDTYIEKTREALNLESDAFAYVRFFDIKIVDKNGEKVEIAAPVDVQIELADKDTSKSAGDNTKVVHFADGEETGEVIDSLEVNGDKLSFTAPGFSAYAIVEGPASVPAGWHTISTFEELIEKGSSGLYVGHVLGYYFTNAIQFKDNRTGILKTTPAQTYPASGAAVYYFEPAGNNKVYAYCYDQQNNKQYVYNNNDKNL